MPHTFSSRFRFDPAKRFHLGAEEEVWTVSPKTGLLVAGAIPLFADGEKWPGLKQELPAQQIEAVTPVCPNLKELELALARNRKTLELAARKHGFAISRDPVPVKPFSIQVYPTERYQRIEAAFGARLRGAYVAGLHVHLGLGSREEGIKAMNFVRPYLPAFLSVSARSPVFAGRRTGYRSFRYVQYKEMAGETVPPYLESWEHLERIADAKGWNDDPRMCWWTMRLNPVGTIELRVSDVQADVRHTMAIAAMFRLLVRIAVEKGQRADRVPAEKIEESLMAAAKGAVDAKAFLARSSRLASMAGFEEERSYIKRLL